MKKIKYLDYLYYYINKQNDFGLQILLLEWTSTRKTYHELCFDKEQGTNPWWLKRVNTRTILIPEIVLDYDPGEGWTKEDVRLNLINTVLPTLSIMYESEYVKVFDTTNKGYHVHIFDKRMWNLNRFKREQHRIDIMRMFPCIKQSTGSTLYPDMQKKSERVSIALEYAKHWKTGKVKKELE